MDFNALIAELRTSSENLPKDSADRSLLSSVYCNKACTVLDHIAENTDYDNIITGLWLVAAHFAEQLTYLKPVPALSELCFKLFRQCAKAVLNIQWQNIEEDSSLRQNFLASLANLHAKLVPLDFPRFRLLEALTENPWTNPTLAKVMGGEVEDKDKEEVRSYIEQEDPIILQLRVDMMLKENCEEYALNLCNSCLSHPELQSDLGVRKTQLSLLYKLGHEDRLQEECQKISIQDAVRIIKQLQMAKTHMQICTVLAQTFMVQNWIRPSDMEANKELLRLWIRQQLLVDRENDQFKESVWAMAKLSQSTEQIIIFIDVLREECGETFLQLYVDMCIFAINVDKGQMETNKKEGNLEAAAARRNDMASICAKLSCLCHHASVKVARICALTSFALKPTEQSFAKIGTFYGQGTDCCNKCGRDRNREPGTVNPATLYEVERLLNMLRPDYLSPDQTYVNIQILCRRFLQESLKSAQLVQTTKQFTPQNTTSPSPVSIPVVDKPKGKDATATTSCRSSNVFEAFLPQDFQNTQLLLNKLRIQNIVSIKQPASLPSHHAYHTGTGKSIVHPDDQSKFSPPGQRKPQYMFDAERIKNKQPYGVPLEQQHQYYLTRHEKELEQRRKNAQKKRDEKSHHSTNLNSQTQQQMPQQLQQQREQLLKQQHNEQVSQIIQTALKNDTGALQKLTQIASPSVVQAVLSIMKNTMLKQSPTSYLQKQPTSQSAMITPSSSPQGTQPLPTVSTLLKPSSLHAQQLQKQHEQHRKQQDPPQSKDSSPPRRHPKPQLYAQPIIVSTSNNISPLKYQQSSYSMQNSRDQVTLGSTVSSAGDKHKSSNFMITKSHVNDIRQLMQTQMSNLQQKQISEPRQMSGSTVTLTNMAVTNSSSQGSFSLTNRPKTTVELAEQAALARLQKQENSKPVIYPQSPHMKNSGQQIYTSQSGQMFQKSNQQFMSSPGITNTNVHHHHQQQTSTFNFQNTQNSCLTSNSVLPSSDELSGSITGIDDTIIKELLQDSGILANTFPDIEVDTITEDSKSRKIPDFTLQPQTVMPVNSNQMLPKSSKSQHYASYSTPSNTQTYSTIHSTQSHSLSKINHPQNITTSSYHHHHSVSGTTKYPQMRSPSASISSSVSLSNQNKSLMNHTQSSTFSSQNNQIPNSSQMWQNSKLPFSQRDNLNALPKKDTKQELKPTVDQIREMMKREDIQGEIYMDAANNATYRCIICSFAFDTLDNLREHVRNVCKPGLQSSSVYNTKIKQDRANSAKAGVETTTVFQCLRCFELCVSDAGIKQHRLTCKRVPTVPSDLKKEAVSNKPKTVPKPTVNKQQVKKDQVDNSYKIPEMPLPFPYPTLNAEAVLKSMSRAGSMISQNQNPSHAFGSKPHTPMPPDSKLTTSTLTTSPSIYCTTLPISKSITLPVSSSTSSSNSTQPPSSTVGHVNPISISSTHINTSSISAVDSISLPQNEIPLLDTVTKNNLKEDLNQEDVEKTSSKTNSQVVCEPRYIETTGSGGSKFYKCGICSQTLCSFESFLVHWEECSVKNKNLLRRLELKEKALNAKPITGEVLENLLKIIAQVAMGDGDILDSISSDPEWCDDDDWCSLKDPCAVPSLDGTDSCENTNSTSWCETEEYDSRGSMNDTDDVDDEKYAGSNEHSRSTDGITGANDVQGKSNVEEGSEKDSEMFNKSKRKFIEDTEEDSNSRSYEDKNYLSTREAPPKLRDRKTLKPIQSFINEVFNSSNAKTVVKSTSAIFDERDKELAADEKTSSESEAESDGESLFCKVCQISFQTKRILLQHFAGKHLQPYTVKTVADSASYFCHLCQKTFSTFMHYMQHVPNHSVTIYEKMKVFISCRKSAQRSERIASQRGLAKKNSVAPKMKQALKIKRASAKSALEQLNQQILADKTQSVRERLRISKRKRSLQSTCTSSEDDYSSDASNNVVFKLKKPTEVESLTDEHKPITRSRNTKKQKSMSPDKEDDSSTQSSLDQSGEEIEKGQKSARIRDEDYVLSEDYDSDEAAGTSTPPTTRSRKRNIENLTISARKKTRASYVYHDELSDRNDSENNQKHLSFISESEDSNGSDIILSQWKNGICMIYRSNVEMQGTKDDANTRESTQSEGDGKKPHFLYIRSLSKQQKARLMSSNLQPAVVLKTLHHDHFESSHGLDTLSTETVPVLYTISSLDTQVSTQDIPEDSSNIKPSENSCSVKSLENSLGNKAFDKSISSSKTFDDLTRSKTLEISSRGEAPKNLTSSITHDYSTDSISLENSNRSKESKNYTSTKTPENSTNENKSENFTVSKVLKSSTSGKTLEDSTISKESEEATSIETLEISTKNNVPKNLTSNDGLTSGPVQSKNSSFLDSFLSYLNQYNSSPESSQPVKKKNELLSQGSEAASKHSSRCRSNEPSPTTHSGSDSQDTQIFESIPETGITVSRSRMHSPDLTQGNVQNNLSKFPTRKCSVNLGQKLSLQDLKSSKNVLIQTTKAVGHDVAAKDSKTNPSFSSIAQDVSNVSEDSKISFSLNTTQDVASVTAEKVILNENLISHSRAEIQDKPGVSIENSTANESCVIVEIVTTSQNLCSQNDTIAQTIDTTAPPPTNKDNNLNVPHKSNRLTPDLKQTPVVCLERTDITEKYSTRSLKPAAANERKSHCKSESKLAVQKKPCSSEVKVHTSEPVKGRIVLTITSDGNRHYCDSLASETLSPNVSADLDKTESTGMLSKRRKSTCCEIKGAGLMKDETKLADHSSLAESSLPDNVFDASVELHRIEDTENCGGSSELDRKKCEGNDQHCSSVTKNDNENSITGSDKMCAVIVDDNVIEPSSEIVSQSNFLGNRTKSLIPAMSDVCNSDSLAVLEVSNNCQTSSSAAGDIDLTRAASNPQDSSSVEISFPCVTKLNESKQCDSTSTVSTETDRVLSCDLLKCDEHEKKPCDFGQREECSNKLHNCAFQNNLCTHSSETVKEEHCTDQEKPAPQMCTYEMGLETFTESKNENIPKFVDIEKQKIQKLYDKEEPEKPKAEHVVDQCKTEIEKSLHQATENNGDSSQKYTETENMETQLKIEKVDLSHVEVKTNIKIPQNFQQSGTSLAVTESLEKVELQNTGTAEADTHTNKISSVSEEILPESNVIEAESCECLNTLETGSNLLDILSVPDEKIKNFLIQNDDRKICDQLPHIERLAENALGAGITEKQDKVLDGQDTVVGNDNNKKGANICRDNSNKTNDKHCSSTKDAYDKPVPIPDIQFDIKTDTDTSNEGDSIKKEGKLNVPNYKMTEPTIKESVVVLEKLEVPLKSQENKVKATLNPNISLAAFIAERLTKEDLELSNRLSQAQKVSVRQIDQDSPLDVGRPSQSHQDLPLDIGRPSQSHQNLPLDVGRPSQSHQNLPLDVGRPSQSHQNLPLVINRPSQIHQNLPLDVGRPSQIHQNLPLDSGRPSQMHQNVPLDVGRPSQSLQNLPIDIGRPSPMHQDSFPINPICSQIVQEAPMNFPISPHFQQKSLSDTTCSQVHQKDTSSDSDTYSQSCHISPSDIPRCPQIVQDEPTGIDSIMNKDHVLHIKMGYQKLDNEKVTQVCPSACLVDYSSSESEEEHVQHDNKNNSSGDADMITLHISQIDESYENINKIHLDNISSNDSDTSPVMQFDGATCFNSKKSSVKGKIKNLGESEEPVLELCSSQLNKAQRNLYDLSSDACDEIHEHSKVVRDDQCIVSLDSQNCDVFERNPYKNQPAENEAKKKKLTNQKSNLSGQDGKILNIEDQIIPACILRETDKNLKKDRSRIVERDNYQKSLSTEKMSEDSMLNTEIDECEVSQKIVKKGIESLNKDVSNEGKQIGTKILNRNTGVKVRSMSDGCGESVPYDGFKENESSASMQSNREKIVASEFNLIAEFIDSGQRILSSAEISYQDTRGNALADLPKAGKQQNLESFSGAFHNVGQHLKEKDPIQEVEQYSNLEKDKSRSSLNLETECAEMDHGDVGNIKPLSWVHNTERDYSSKNQSFDDRSLCVSTEIVKSSRSCITTEQLSPSNVAVKTTHLSSCYSSSVDTSAENVTMDSLCERRKSDEETDEGDDLSDFDLVIEKDTSNRSLSFPLTLEKKSYSAAQSSYYNVSVSKGKSNYKHISANNSKALVYNRVQETSLSQSNLGVNNLQDCTKNFRNNVQNQFVWDVEEDTESKNKLHNQRPPVSVASSKVFKTACSVKEVALRPALEALNRKQKALREKTETAPFTWDLEDFSDSSPNKVRGHSSVQSLSKKTGNNTLSFDKSNLIHHQSISIGKDHQKMAHRTRQLVPDGLKEKISKLRKTSVAKHTKSTSAFVHKEVNKQLQEGTQYENEMSKIELSTKDSLETFCHNSITVDEDISFKIDPLCAPLFVMSEKLSPHTLTYRSGQKTNIKRRDRSHKSISTTSLSETEHNERYECSSHADELESCKSLPGLRSHYSSEESNKSILSKQTAQTISHPVHHKRLCKTEDPSSPKLKKLGLIKVSKDSPSPSASPSRTDSTAPVTRSSKAAIKAFNQKSLRSRGVNLTHSSHSQPMAAIKTSPQISHPKNSPDSNSKLKTSIPIHRLPSSSSSLTHVSRNSSSESNITTSPKSLTRKSQHMDTAAVRVVNRRPPFPSKPYELIHSKTPVTLRTRKNLSGHSKHHHAGGNTTFHAASLHEDKGNYKTQVNQTAKELKSLQTSNSKDTETGPKKDTNRQKSKWKIKKEAKLSRGKQQQGRPLSFK